MKRGQIWIETVIYTLIGLSVIALVLGMIKPEIDQRKDSIYLEQNAEVLDYIDSVISEIKYVSGNSRNLQIKIGRGKFFIDPESDLLKIVVDDSKYEYSEPGVIINSRGDVKAITEEIGKKYSVTLALNYSGKLNVTYRGSENIKIYQPSPSEYTLTILNKGAQGGLINIDFA